MVFEIFRIFAPRVGLLVAFRDHQAIRSGANSLSQWTTEYETTFPAASIESFLRLLIYFVATTILVLMFNYESYREYETFLCVSGRRNVCLAGAIARLVGYAIYRTSSKV